VPLRESHLDVRPVELEVVPVPIVENRRDAAAISVGELERARKKMVEICETLAGSALRHYPATDDPEACRWCAYAEACREQPALTEARFGR
jgi:hypothetical protein